MKKKSGRIWKIKPFIGKYNRKEINYPSGKNYWKKNWEKQSSDCSLSWQWKECVPLTNSYQLYFFRITNAWSMLHHRSVKRFQSNEWYFMLHTPFWNLLLFFHQKMWFYHSHFSFSWSVKFLQQNINQSETKIGGSKLSVELYEKTYLA